MHFRVDVHWSLILWFWLRHDDLLYLERSRKLSRLNLLNLLTAEFIFSKFEQKMLEKKFLKKILEKNVWRYISKKKFDRKIV